jgi:RNA polymerase sigma-70 factor (ECF subfamily)
MDAGTENTRDLMERYATGDERVFEALYRALAPRLRGFCRRLALHQAEADDLFQETFLKLHRARGTYVTGANVLHWSFAIARSIFLTKLRQRRRRPEQLGAAEDVARQEGIQIQDLDTPEQEALAANQLDVAVDELGRMSEKNRVAYVLMKEEGLSSHEAAAILGTSAAVVKKRVQRACEQLRTALEVGEVTECGSQHGTA